MTAWIVKNELLLRLLSFFGLFVLFMSIERLWPFRQRARAPLGHYFKNLSLILLSSLFLHLIFPLVAVGAAVLAREQQAGLFHLWPMPTWLHIVATLLVFDLLIYGQHRIFHKIPWLWRLHRVHHTDPDFDMSTGIRFHPFEIALSMLLKVGAAYALGASPEGIILFEILLNSSSLFSHLNVQLPEALDRTLRRFIVTPGMHRVHHSVEEQFMQANFGFHLSIWDHLFRTYRHLPLAKQKNMEIGVKGWTDESLPRLLIQPLR